MQLNLNFKIFRCFSFIILMGGEIMGCGLVALSLWLLLGGYIRINTGTLISPFIFQTILLWGSCEIVKKYNCNSFKNSIVFGILYLILFFFNEYLFVEVIRYILITFQILLLFKGILKISQKYNEYKKAKEKLKVYIIVFICMNIAYIIKVISNGSEVFGESLFMFVMFINTISLTQHLLSINNYLYMIDEDVKVENPIPRKTSYKVFSSFVMLLTVICLSFANMILPDLVFKYGHDVDFILLSGKSEHFIVENLYVYHYKEYNSIPKLNFPNIYADKNILENNEITKVQLKIYQKSHTFFNTISNTIGIIDSEIVGYKRVLMKEQDFINEDEIMNLLDLDNQISIIIYFKDDNNIEKEETIELESIDYKEYGYEDSKVSIDSVFVVEEDIVVNPRIRIKQDYIKQYNMDIYIKGYFYIDDKIIDEFRIDYEPLKDYDAIVEGSHLNWNGPYHLKNIKIKLEFFENYNSSNLLDTIEYTLEEIQ